MAKYNAGVSLLLLQHNGTSFHVKFGCDRRRGRSKADSDLANSDVFRDFQYHLDPFVLQNHANNRQISEWMILERLKNCQVSEFVA